MPNELIRNFDYVEMFVGSAKVTAYWFVKALGFEIIAYKGPENGSKESCSYYIQKNKIKFVLTSSLTPRQYEINSFVTKHGQGISRISFEVDDVELAFKQATDKKAVPVKFPDKSEDEFGVFEDASVGIFDDTELYFNNYDNYKGPFVPGFTAMNGIIKPNDKDTALEEIDHIVGNVRENEMERWANYFINSFNFEEIVSFGPGDIETQYTSLISKVVASKDRKIRIPINEPFDGIKKSQIDEYIEEYKGTGIQHVALMTNDIIQSISVLRENGVEFIDIPDSYYDMLKEKHDKLPKEKQMDESFDELKRLGILCDFETEGYLLQLFTKPIGDRPTLFFEIIQRKRGASGFGHGNFLALFQAMEKDQASRGDLVDRKNRSSLKDKS
ncbi:MAG: 4-hydroxyphenylpyruvate dioxygenase [Planctomycetota bacterium]|nr:MAG: 4-hydroxyphenylpyruvate dioxygenase [Planctomycetota bacterium]